MFFNVHFWGTIVFKKYMSYDQYMANVQYIISDSYVYIVILTLNWLRIYNGY